MKAWLEKGGKFVTLPGLPAIECNFDAKKVYLDECEKRRVVAPDKIEIDIEMQGDLIMVDGTEIAEHTGLLVLYKHLAKKLNEEYKALRAKIDAQGCELRPSNPDNCHEFTDELWVAAIGDPCAY